MEGKDTQICVEQVANPQRNAPAFFLYGYPSMLLHEDGSRWLSSRAKRCNPTHQRNLAYGIAYWLTYCLAIGTDYTTASHDDLDNYKTALSNVVSEKTKELLSTGTIRSRLSSVIEYYSEKRAWIWYKLAPPAGSIENAAHNTVRISKDSYCLLPKAQSTRSDIRPLTPDDLTSVLNALGWNEYSKRTESTRDRLIAEWMAYVGLRMSEVLGSAVYPGLRAEQINDLAGRYEDPFGHSAVSVTGKYNKRRTVAVPNWLVAKTTLYIQNERAKGIREEMRTIGPLFLASPGKTISSNYRNISSRRYQAIFEQACIASRITRSTECTKASESPKERAKHTPHDLRHTYAIMTYFAERELGNSEPWKPIQTQLGHKNLRTTVETYLDAVSVFTQWGRDLRRMSVRELAGLPHAY